MTVAETFLEDMPLEKSPKVKLRAGASIVKVCPLFTSDSKHVVLASGCDIKVYSISSGECSQTLKKHKAPVISLQQYKPNNLQILSCSEDGFVYRWDCASGTAVMKYNLRIKTSLTAFYAPMKENVWFLTTKTVNTDVPRLISLRMNKREKRAPVKKTVILSKVLADPKAVAFGVDCKFLVGIYDNLRIYDFKTRSLKRYFVGLRNLICVACHPSQYIVATGDSIGNIYVWANILISSKPTRSIYHWHTLPVSHLCFSAEGSHIYSGGGEAALVKWNLNSGSNQIVPRLGLPILLLSVSPDNSLVAMCHADNAVQIINVHRKIVQIIQGLTLGHFRGIGASSGIRTGSLYDPRSKSLVLNGQPGHLQFYKIHEDKQLFSLDIVGRNILTQERDRVIINTDIDKAALDYKGQWLATVESWDDKEHSPEICLKFWEYQLNTQEFVLNTRIDFPHSEEVTCLKFRPPPTNPDESYKPMAVTTSKDNCFKIWLLCDDKDGGNCSSYWKCDFVGNYQRSPVGDACFSPDGSLLAVIFHHTITLWEPTLNVFSNTIHHEENQNPIKQVAFGYGKSSRFLVCYSDCMLRVLNFLSNTVHWTMMCNVQCLAMDPESETMVAFTQERNMFVFNPESAQPLFFLNDISRTPVVSAIFVPQPSSFSEASDTSALSWQKKSQLFFMNSSQELLTITEEEDEDDDDDTIKSEKVQLHQNLPLTPFALLQPQHQISGVKAKEVEYDSAQSLISIEGNKTTSSETSYTYQNLVALCSETIPAFLIPRNKEKLSEIKKDVKSSAEKSDTDSDDEEISRLLAKQKKTVIFSSKISNAMKIDEGSVVGEEDYSFLTDFLPPAYDDVT